MQDAKDLTERHEDLRTRIDEARRRLENESLMDSVEIGTILEDLSSELDDMNDPDTATRHGLYDRMEGKLAEIHGQIDAIARP